MESESWKEFDLNPVTHSAAHHLVAIAELIEEFGYARVSDVARTLAITRGSASVTLKGLKQRKLVIEDENRHLKLSAEGESIARSVRAKKQVLKRFLMQVVGVDEAHAEVDTCKIEHLVSAETARRVSRLLRFAGASTAAARHFLDAFHKFPEACTGNPAECPSCDDRCLEEALTSSTEAEKRKGQRHGK